MKLMFETMGAGAERGMSNPGTLRGVRPVGPTEIDELKRFQDRAALTLGYEERRGAQAIGEAALHVLGRLSNGTADVSGIDSDGLPISCHGRLVSDPAFVSADPGVGLNVAKNINDDRFCMIVQFGQARSCWQRQDGIADLGPIGSVARHLPLPRHNTSELKIAVIADLPAADLAGGHVVQPADAEVDRQSIGERVRETCGLTGCVVGGCHAATCERSDGGVQGSWRSKTAISSTFIRRSVG